MAQRDEILTDVLVDRLIGAGSAGLDNPCLEATAAGNLTSAMVLTWLLRLDLQRTMDLSKPECRLLLLQWCQNAYWHDRPRLQRMASRFTARVNPIDSELDKPQSLRLGANLVGYARGVLGMGEHVRMVARAMVAASLPSGIVDFAPGLGHRLEERDQSLSWQARCDRRCNLLHVNADQMARAYWHLGPNAFRGRYNIGYWAWELARFPAQWRPAIGFVDELWAPSEFIRAALAAETTKPVVLMPLCVELPDFERLPRQDIGLSDGDFVFVFSFDCDSFIARKNPAAIVAAFRRAFAGQERVRLVIKGMNPAAAGPKWGELQAMAQADARISIIGETWQRDRLLSLIAASDCYVSLHRAEGFGRGPAEAMLLNKPVIVTDYSGTQDYCNAENALLVDARLVAVGEGNYPHSESQVWADPDLDQAARHMRTVFANHEFAQALGRAGHGTISRRFDSVTTGKRYAERLATLGLL